MEVKFTNTFFESMKHMAQSNHWYHWRFYRNLYYDIKNNIRSIIRYIKPTTNLVPWEFLTILPMLKKHVDEVTYNLENYGMEIDETRLPKIEKLKRVSYLLDHVYREDFSKVAEIELNLKSSGKYTSLGDTKTEEEEKIDEQIRYKSYEIEETYWKELWDTIRDNSRGWWD